MNRSLLKVLSLLLCLDTFALSSCQKPIEAPEKEDLSPQTSNAVNGRNVQVENETVKNGEVPTDDPKAPEQSSPNTPEQSGPKVTPAPATPVAPKLPTIPATRAYVPDLRTKHGQADTAPETWKEHWFAHEQLLKRVYMDKDIVLYFDDDVNKEKALAYLVPLLKAAWAHARLTYGNFGSTRLYGIFHGKKYGGGHPATYGDASHDYRNVIDLGAAGDWSAANDGWTFDATVHEIGHIVEGAGFEKLGSPAFPVWKDSKWCEVFVYSVYKAVELPEHEKRLFDSVMASAGDDFPAPKSKWFQNWFYPLYKDRGGSAGLAKYFTVLSQYFPKNNEQRYTRDMDLGEYIHFMSGAYGVNLKAQATKAFGWTPETEAQFQKARTTFPQLRY